ncbi:MAG: hypothetical protein ABIQ01_09785 [Pseudolysinimonas sp.]
MADALNTAFHFADEDLVANRAGRLSPAQQVRMSKMRGRAQVANLVFGGIFLVIMVIIAIVVLPGLLAPQPAGSSAVPPGIIVLVLVGVVGIIVLSVLRSRRKLAGVAGAVMMTEGDAKTRSGMVDVGEGAGMASVYRLTVGSVTFALSGPDQLAPFVDGRRYRVYYVRGTLPVVVSAEAV